MLSERTGMPKEKKKKKVTSNKLNTERQACSLLNVEL